MGREELVMYLKMLSFKKIAPDIKFTIFGQGRTGSSLLVDLLNSHPDVNCDSEILEKRKLFPELYVEAKARCCTKKAYGYKVKIYQLTCAQGIDSGRFIKSLIRNRWKIIYLWRENIFLHAISNFVAGAQNKFIHWASDGPLNLPKITIPVTSFIECMEGRRRVFSSEKKIVSSIPHLELNYERDLFNAADQQKTLHKVFDYLGLPHVTVSTDLVKIVPSKWHEIIENHEELVRAVKNTPYARFVP